MNFDNLEMQSTPRDLDSPEAIAEMLDAFYRKVLADDRLRPLFLDVAEIDLRTHLPCIRAYWCKLLLGERDGAQVYACSLRIVRFGKGGIRQALLQCSARQALSAKTSNAALLGLGFLLLSVSLP